MLPAKDTHDLYMSISGAAWFTGTLVKTISRKWYGARDSQAYL